jgi:DNA-binding MarR family transcriptional regulator
MSLLVDRLVRAGFIRRDRDPADGRRVALRLTDSGSRAVRTRSLLDPERVRALLASLPADERSAAVAGVLTLARAARRLSNSSITQNSMPKGRS